MAKLFLTPIDLGYLEILNAKFQILATATLPTVSDHKGFFAFDDTTKTLKYSDGTKYINVIGHPSVTATTIEAENKKVISAIILDSNGHITSVSSKNLAFADMPDMYIGTTKVQGTSANQALSGITTISASGVITFSNATEATALNSAAVKLSGGLSVTKNIFLGGKKIYFGDTTHYLELDDNGFHFSHGVYSDSFISALGLNSSGSSGGGGGHELLTDWSEYGDGSDKGEYVVSAPLIYNIYTASNSATSNITSLSTRVGSLEALLNGTDNTKIDTINEVYNFLNQYAQTTDLATLLGAKVNTADLKTLTFKLGTTAKVTYNTTSVASVAFSGSTTGGKKISITESSGTFTFALTDTYAGGTAITLNNTSKASSTASFYAPTDSGTSGQVLKSKGSGNAPEWVDFNADKVGTSTVGGTTEPIYLNEGTPTKCSQYAGGTKVTLNGTDKGASAISIYAPVGSGNSGELLVSGGANTAPSWSSISTLKMARIQRTTITGVANQTAYSLDHTFGEVKVLVQVYDSENNEVVTDVKYDSTSKKTQVIFAEAPVGKTFDVIVVG